MAGTVISKIALRAKWIYAKMAEPKWDVAVEACGPSRGMYRSFRRPPPSGRGANWHEREAADIVAREPRAKA